MRKILAIAVLLTATTSVFAQSLTEKIDVSVVNVDVTVTTHGSPARGLTRDDFVVLEDGVPQNITNFYTIGNSRDKAVAATPSAAAPPAPPPVADERFRRKVLVIFDNRHMSIHNRDVALGKLEQFINDRFDSGSYDWSIAMLGDQTRVLLPLTSDKQRIHGALAEIRKLAAGRGLRDFYQVEDRTAPIYNNSAIESIALGSLTNSGVNRLIEQANLFQAAEDAVTTYSGILEAARSFANAPGRKLILLMTGAFAEDENALFSFDPSLTTQRFARVSALRSWLIREANASDCSISVIDVEGLIPLNMGADSRGPDFNGAAFASADRGLRGGISSTGSLFWIARETGGQSFTGNYVDKSLRDFDLATSNFYSLAYHPNHPEDNRYHSITVRLKTPGRYTLSYRNGYSSIPIEEQIERAMRSALAADMQPSAMPLNLTTGPVTAADVPGAILVPLLATVSAKELQFVPSNNGSVARVDIYVSVFDDSGRLIRTFRTVREAHAKAGTEGDGNFVASHAVRLRKGKPYRLVVAIHDQVSDAIAIKSEDVRF
ncbi:MAG TPA: VWA domain-containing protein [Thermoanaerobaculia bacterium]|nr:VWA domain-containing protein [Thermoanaerobaculia bacterium]